MRLVSFVRPDGSASYGRLENDTIRDCDGDLATALADGSWQAEPGGGTFALSAVTLLPPIPKPGRILCVGLNYVEHIRETGQKMLEHPAIFTRWPSTLVAHGAPLVRPRESVRFDYEGELAVVIGKRGRRIAKADAWDHVAGFAPFHDGSVRDWQRHNSQFTPGKNFPGTGGFGPALVTPDEVDDFGSQRVQTRLNGEVVQDQPLSDLLFDIPELLAYISTFTELEPGDVIATGTPGGVGDKREPPMYMKGGDSVEVSIGVIGTLVNPVIDEA